MTRLICHVDGNAAKQSEDSRERSVPEETRRSDDEDLRHADERKCRLELSCVHLRSEIGQVSPVSWPRRGNALAYVTKSWGKLPLAAPVFQRLGLPGQGTLRKLLHTGHDVTVTSYLGSAVEHVHGLDES